MRAPIYVLRVAFLWKAIKKASGILRLTIHNASNVEGVLRYAQSSKYRFKAEMSEMSL